VRVEPSTGLVIGGKYRLLERIGVGGMSEVYRATNLQIGRIVALKLLLPSQAHDPSLADRFAQEAQAASQIRHPSIVDVLDAGEGETGPYIVMEYLEGESAARSLTRQGKLSLSAALATLLPVLDALGAAHQAGIVHRDLKPENVFYSLDDAGDITVKLLDFGIAKLLWPSGPSPRTSTGVVFGTPDYLSPEQANGEPVIDGRSDLFSAAVVLFELLTNKRPFHAPTTVATAYKIAHAQAPLLRDHGGPANPTLDAIMTRALAKRPSERHPDVHAFARELRLLARSEDELRRALRELVPIQRASGVQRAARSTARSDTPRSPTPGERKRAEAPLVSPQPAGDTRPSPDYARTPQLSSGVKLARPRASQAEPEPGRGTPPSRRASGRLRSLPSRFAGQCHARGIVLSAIDQYVQERFPGPRARVLEQLDPQHAREYVDRTLQAIVYYELDAITGYLELVTSDACQGNPAWARLAGENAATGELAPVLRIACRPDRLLTVVRRVVPVCSRFFDFGIWEVDGAGNALSVRVSDFEPASLTLRHWLTGVLDGALRAAELRAQLTIARGDASFSPQLLIDVTAR
jgi:eukaryotic-like serine/threonine-protein kinase